MKKINVNYNNYDKDEKEVFDLNVKTITEVLDEKITKEMGNKDSIKHYLSGFHDGLGILFGSGYKPERGVKLLCGSAAIAYNKLLDKYELGD
jgi:hypothetical protein